MRRFTLLGVSAMLALLAPPLGAPVSAQQTEKPKTAPDSKLVTLSGCVADDSTSKGSYRLSGSADGAAYKLTGLDVHKYAGQRVQVSGRSPHRIRIVGGLYPSPNVAAQAGAIDPVQAAIAAQQPQTASGPLPELRVTRVRPIPGDCPSH